MPAIAAQAQSDQDAAVTGLAAEHAERLGEIDRRHRRGAGPLGSGRRGDGVRPTPSRRTAPPRRPKAREVVAPGPSSFPRPGSRTPPQGARRVTPSSGPSRNLRFYAAINSIAQPSTVVLGTRRYGASVARLEQGFKAVMARARTSDAGTAASRDTAGFGAMDLFLDADLAFMGVSLRETADRRTNGAPSSARHCSGLQITQTAKFTCERRTPGASRPPVGELAGSPAPTRSGYVSPDHWPRRAESHRSECDLPAFARWGFVALLWALAVGERAYQAARQRLAVCRGRRRDRRALLDTRTPQRCHRPGRSATLPGHQRTGIPPPGPERMPRVPRPVCRSQRMPPTRRKLSTAPSRSCPSVPLPLCFAGGRV